MILICENKYGSINLTGHPRLVRFPGIVVRGSLTLSGCPKLQGLEDGLVVERYLDLEDCSALTDLPEGLEVGWNLWLQRTVSLTALPKGLQVGRVLFLKDSGVSEIPEDARIDGEIIGLGEL